MQEIKSLVDSFTSQLSALLDRQAEARTVAALESAFGATKRGPGRPAKLATRPLVHESRHKPPKQLCPVPGCKNPAAPVFGMVCAEHKDVSKIKIQKYRDARRAKRLQAA